jgi:hypothetical protein
MSSLRTSKLNRLTWEIALTTQLVMFVLSFLPVAGDYLERLVFKLPEVSSPTLFPSWFLSVLTVAVISFVAGLFVEVLRPATGVAFGFLAAYMAVVAASLHLGLGLIVLLTVAFLLVSVRDFEKSRISFYESYLRAMQKIRQRNTQPN